MTIGIGEPKGFQLDAEVSVLQVPGRSPRPAWRCPVITRIDIKRTMLNTGSHIDGAYSSDGTQ